MIKLRCGYPNPCDSCAESDKPTIVVYEYGSDIAKLRLCKNCFDKMVSEYMKICRIAGEKLSK